MDQRVPHLLLLAGVLDAGYPVVQLVAFAGDPEHGRPCAVVKGTQGLKS